MSLNGTTILKLRQWIWQKADPEAEFDAYRDKAVADTTQGNPTSTSNPADISRQLDNIDQRMDGDYGSTDSPLTVREADRMATLLAKLLRLLGSW